MQKSTAVHVQELPRCQWCGIEFLPNHKKQIYHSDACRQKAFQEAKKQKQQAAAK